MKKGFVILAMFMASLTVFGQSVFNRIPRAWKWIGPEEVIFSYDGSFADSTAFAYDASRGRIIRDVSAPEKFSDFPVHPEGAVNLTYSPDSTLLAFTRDNDLYVIDIASGDEKRLTFDGTDLILNGYASWVYYEEIFGRPSQYRAFWWSPDSRKIGFYRFDNTEVPFFPIYSPFGQDGTLRQTRYPKAGEHNPDVRIGIVSVDGLFGVSGDDALTVIDSVDDQNVPEIVWADFDPAADCYYGTPFWGPDSQEIYITRMPRVQNTFDIYAVSASDGSKRHVYNEKYDTWIDWISDMIFTKSGLYMVRSFETGWEQIYFLSYSGELRRLTEGQNWRVQLIRVDERRGDVYFTAQRDSRLRSVLYRLDPYGNIVPLTDTAMNVASVSFSPDGRYFVASLSNAVTPTKIVVATTAKAAIVAPAGASFPALNDVSDKGVNSSDSDEPASVASSGVPVSDELASADGSSTADASAAGSDSKKSGKGRKGGKAFFNKVGNVFKPKVTMDYVKTLSSGVAVVADMAPEDYDPADYALPETVWMTTADGFSLPAQITYPKDFDPQKKYPVHVDIYGGPNTPMVRDRWIGPTPSNQWWAENGIIEVVADCRAAGHNGRAGTDMIYRDLISWPVKDFIAWADWLKEFPYVDGDKIGVEGFSFGGSMTAALVFTAPDSYHYGIAGGGVYDWQLYDSHYTERFMETPQTNPEGYAAARVLDMVGDYRAEYPSQRGPRPGDPAPDAAEASGDAQPDELAENNAGKVAPVMLRITHGTGDDNVHFQNTLQLIDELQKQGKEFELMIYPDGMHGYRGYQARHFDAGNRAFWLKYLK
ncbi:MAG: S9 family peptidase, partial [Bacteroidales bacterium]|nr:S9 family peptidase [Bacteroidales bacterium]